jgi:hypothetical protein
MINTVFAPINLSHKPTQFVYSSCSTAEKVAQQIFFTYLFKDERFDHFLSLVYIFFLPCLTSKRMMVQEKFFNYENFCFRFIACTDLCFCTHKFHDFAENFHVIKNAAHIKLFSEYQPAFAFSSFLCFPQKRKLIISA